MFAISTALALAVTVAPQDPGSWVTSQLEELEQLYRHFHQNPELSFREIETAKRLAAELEQAGLQVTTGVGGTGVVAVLDNGPGRTVMMRTDLDALPIAEDTGLPYASKIRADSADGRAIGIMHACGHDLHMTNLVGTAQWFANHLDEWSGTLVFIGQPAEERSGGARAMLKDGLYERFPKPDAAVALHCDPALPTGTVGVRPGALMAAVDSVDVTLFGKGGHGAAPHRTVDPIVLAAQYVLALQTIVSREINPIQSAVITVGSIHAGSKHNIISDRCKLQLTVRSYDPDVRQHLLDAIVHKGKALATAARAPEPEFAFSEATDPLLNDPAVTAKIRSAMEQALGTEHVVEVQPQMIAEDFAFYGSDGVPICMFRLGTIAPERLDKLNQQGGPPSLHSPSYYPDARQALEAGIPASVAAIRALL